MLATLLLTTLALSAAQDAEAYYDVPLTELVPEFLEGLPERSETDGLGDWRRRLRRFATEVPYALLEGGGEAVVQVPGGPGDTGAWSPVPRFAEGRLHVHVTTAREVRGRLFLPNLEGEGMTAHAFVLSAERATDADASWSRAQAEHYRRLSTRRIPGGAWFRNRVGFFQSELGEEDATADDVPAGPEGELATTPESLALFMGGRAVSENLQLDRLLPIQKAEEETVALDTLEGIEVRAFDWKPLLDEKPPALDALAAAIPADQHAVFFTSFRALSAVHGELENAEAFLGGLDQRGMALASVRDRVQAQLALPWNAVVRAFGERAIDAVAITGGDPYYPSGTDVAILFETGEPDALLTLLAVLRASAAPDAMVSEGEVLGVRWRGAETPGRVVSSYAAVLTGTSTGTVVVANSHAGLAAVIRAAKGEAPRLGETEEYRFFRQRYRIDAERERALLIVPDEAIRRWCGPRWRIAASRRVRAAAVLADLQARNLDACIDGRQVRMRPDPRYPLGGLQLLPSGVASSEYGTLAFQTPIRELAFERVGKREAELYASWRQGYLRNWSTFFDPIAIELEVTADGLRADVTVLPLIDFSDYDDLRSYVGDARLGATDGDPHPEALAHFTMALDREAETFAQYRMMASSMLPDIGADPFSWVGSFVSVYIDRDDEYLARVRAGEEALDASTNWNAIPIALHVDVTSGLKLATFLTGLRALAEQIAPGMVEWKTEEEGEHRFVRLGSSEVGENDVFLYYATTPGAWILSPNRPTLVRALVRAKSEEQPPTASWAGQSVGFELSRDGLVLEQVLEGRELAENLRRLAYDRLPILNEWKRRYPDRDPVELHARFWAERLRCPGAGELSWNERLGTMESSVFGSPAEPGVGVELPPGLAEFQRLTFGLLFEHEGVRARAVLVR